MMLTECTTSFQCVVLIFVRTMNCRCVILVEGSEESGSRDLPAYMESLRSSEKDAKLAQKLGQL
jgi:hypothetical protein